MEKPCKTDMQDILRRSPVILCPPKNARALILEGRRLVAFVRHGQTDWNLVLRLQGRESVPLNETGALQSEKCGELLREASELGLEIKGVFTSPLSRAINTAGAICDALGGGLRPIEEELLLERDYGELSGLTPAERRDRFPKGDKEAEGVESRENCAERLKNSSCIIAKKIDGAALAVTHGGILNAMYHKITGGRIGTGKNICANCSISFVAAGKGACIPLTYNLTDEVFLDYVEKLRLDSLPKKSRA